MKFTYALAAVVAAAASVQASETNAQRLARGLNPLPPRKLHHSSRTTSMFNSPFPSPRCRPSNLHRFRPSIFFICLTRISVDRSIYFPDAKRASPSGTPSNSCTTGPVQCCNSMSKANDSVVSAILGLLDLVVDPDVLVGVQCSPLSVVGVGSGSTWYALFSAETRASN